MIIGVPKEIKNKEFRVGLTPGNVHELTSLGHQVYVETNAGSGIGFEDAHYQYMGAKVVDSAQEIYAKSEMIVKVKEPQQSERELLRAGQILFTYLHLAPDVDQTNDLIESEVIAIAYETVTSLNGQLPLLAPMSEVAGRMSIQAAAHYLEKPHGGSGILMGGIPGVESANVVILGAGVVGSSALQMAIGMGSHVTIVDKNLNRLRELDAIYGGRIQTRFSSPSLLDELFTKADVVIGGVLIPGASAPKLLTRQHVDVMRSGSVVVDVAIDQGGCFETSIPTTHDDPVFKINEVTHYCVANMPGAVPRTSTLGLTNATFPFIKELASKGFMQAIKDNAPLRNGVSTYLGDLTCSATAASQQRTYRVIDELMK
jgi:alanine dehydrogenase